MSPIANKDKIHNGTSAGNSEVSVDTKNASNKRPSSSGLSDQYSDGKAADMWKLYIGDDSERTGKYKSFLVNLLKRKNCKKVFDAACGTGVDSVMLLEEGFEMVSSDGSDKMLKSAYKTRWERRKEEQFDNWVIEEANWLQLEKAIKAPEGGFDALLCIGNSFAHLPDSYGDQRDHHLAIQNFYRMLKPGGLLIIDHRNYDYILDYGTAPKNNIYYNSKHILDIKTSILFVNNKANKITLDYEMDLSSLESYKEEEIGHFQLSYYPHRLQQFTGLLLDTFGSKAKHDVYADFKPLTFEPNPAFYIHTIEKPL